MEQFRANGYSRLRRLQRLGLGTPVSSRPPPSSRCVEGVAYEIEWRVSSYPSFCTILNESTAAMTFLREARLETPARRHWKPDIPRIEVARGLRSSGQHDTCSIPRPVVKVTLGVLSSIAPASSGTCTDGDGTSLTLLAGVVRTEVRRVHRSLFRF